MIKYSPTVQKYLETLPKLEVKLRDPSLGILEKSEIYDVYKEMLRVCARESFDHFNQYLELDEDKSDATKGFHYHRRNHLREVWESLNELEHDVYHTVIISMSPRAGKSTYALRYLTFAGGRNPEQSSIGTSYSDNICQSFYNGYIEIVDSQAYQEIFPESIVVNRNAKREEIWLKRQKRYPTVVFAPVDGSLTGRCESSERGILYMDDLVANLEMALSPVRLEALWGKYTVNLRQRKKKGAKELHIGTKWSVHDVISRVSEELRDDPKAKIVSMPCYDENGESRLDYVGGFDTAYFKDLESKMDSASFSALYLCEAIERDGLLYPEEDLQTYLSLPEGKPDAIIGVVDTKGTGKDYLSAPIAYVYGDEVYIEDVVFTNELPEITIPKVTRAMLEHKVQRLYIEAQSGGEYFGRMVEEEIRKGGGNTAIRTFFTTKNKEVKIVMQSDFVKKNFIFKDKSLYSKNSAYGEFMRQLLSYSQTAKKNKHDDAPDSVAMLAEFIQTLVGNKVQIMDRRSLRI